MSSSHSPLHISVVIFPGVSATAAVGACDVLNSAGTLQAAFGSEEEDRLHFSAELVGPRRGLIDCASGVTLRAARGTPAVLGALAALAAAQAAFTYLPAMNALFATRALAPADLLLACGAGVVLMLVLEAEKALVRRLSLFEELAGSARS